MAIGPNDHYDLDVLRDLRAGKGDNGRAIQQMMTSPLFGVAMDGYLAVDPHAKDNQRANVETQRKRAFAARMRRITKQKSL
jgi:chloramphenicol 3-O-phosphotransferase